MRRALCGIKFGVEVLQLGFAECHHLVLTARQGWGLPSCVTATAARFYETGEIKKIKVPKVQILTAAQSKPPFHAPWCPFDHECHPTSITWRTCQTKPVHREKGEPFTSFRIETRVRKCSHYKGERPRRACGAINRSRSKEARYGGTGLRTPEWRE